MKVKKYISTPESRRQQAKNEVEQLKNKLIELAWRRQELNKEEEMILSDLDKYTFLSKI